MKTIEERAMEYAPEPLNKHYAISAFIARENERQAYIAGATEQKAIDDAELSKLKSSWGKQAQINHDDESNYQQGYHDAIEQACELLDTYLMEIADLYDCRANLLLSRVTKKLRIAMEKKL